MENKSLRVAIVGGGLSGTLTAIDLVKAVKSPTTILLIEKDPDQVMRGVAYHPDNLFLPLNVPVKKMSLFSSEPDHFHKWLKANRDKYPDALPDIDPEAFVSRGVYGDYIENTFRDTLAHAAEGVKVENVIGEVVAINPSGNSVDLQLNDRETLQADKVILALGNFPPADVSMEDTLFYRSDRYISSPWNNNGVNSIGRQSDILILGAGLTMVDILITLQRNGYKGNIYTLSRHGLLPRPHATATEIKLQLPQGKTTMLGLLKLLRNEIRKAEENGHNWRTVLDSLRAQTPQIWQSLAVEEKGKFVRFLKSYWDAHRHRIPQSSQKLIDQLTHEGRFHSYAGRLVDIKENGKKIEVGFRLKGQSQLQSITVDEVINCTGPQPDFSRVPSSLVTQLLKSGQASLDPLKMGFELDDRGALIKADGAVSDRIFTIGPMRKGVWWESTALREIRLQAEELSNVI